MAFVHKTRLNGEAVEARAVIGDVRCRVPLIVHDMLSTETTIETAVLTCGHLCKTRQP